MTDAAGSEVAARRQSDVLLVGGVLLGVAVATFVYRLVVETLLDDGTFIAQDGYPGDLRDGALRFVPWVLVAGVIVAGVIARRRHELHVTRATIGAMLLGAGFAWFAWSTLDMHALGVYDWPEGESRILADLAYHGGATVLAAVGWIMMTSSPDRSSRP